MSKFESLPLEIHQQIISECVAVPYDDDPRWILLDLSATCTIFRRLLRPAVVARYFTHKSFQNSERCGSRVRALADSQLASSVRSLTFTASTDHGPCNCREAYRDAQSLEAITEPEADCDMGVLLHADVEWVLSNLSKFPDLDTFTVGFEVPWEFTHAYWDEICERVPETDEQVMEAEETRCWRAMMAKTFDAIAQNVPYPAKELVISDLVFRRVSSLEKVKWHRFLNHVESFKLEIPGGENGAGWDLIAWEGFAEVTTKFDEWYFDHLENVKRFTLRADRTGALGPGAPLALRSGHLPSLRRLELTYVFISQDLVDMLVETAPQLESVVMRDVMAHGKDQGHVMWEWPGNITWAHLMTSVAEMDPHFLVEFDIRPSKWPEDWDHMLCGAEGWEGRVEMKEALREQPERMVFLYATHHDKYAWLVDAGDEVDDIEGATAYHFQLGQDQAAYDRIMSIVEDDQRRQLEEEQSPRPE